jgi:hypothetical protein
MAQAPIFGSDFVFDFAFKMDNCRFHSSLNCPRIHRWRKNTKNISQFRHLANSGTPKILLPPSAESLTNRKTQRKARGRMAIKRAARKTSRSKRPGRNMIARRQLPLAVNRFALLPKSSPRSILLATTT